VTFCNDRPSPEVVRFAQRLRDLREGAPISLTQSDLGRALANAKGAPVSAATVSSWENPSGGRLVPLFRLEAYARLFCTHRSFKGGVHLLTDPELTVDERDVLAKLKEELVGLRDAAAPQAAPAGDSRSIWHFPDNSRVTLVCSRLPPERRPASASANSEELNYVRCSDLADLGALIDIYGAIMAAQDLTQRDISNHLVLIGGLALATVNPWFVRIFPIRIQVGDPADNGAIVVNDPDDGEHKFKYAIVDGFLEWDVGFFARGENPSASRRTLTICGGITPRGAHGAASCFIDHEIRERNEQYLFPRFPKGSPYCIVMRVPIVNNDPLTADLSKKENRPFEWYEGGAEAE
jgi:hypothetical protein